MANSPKELELTWDEFVALLIRLYNTGYHAGHEDTVDGKYVDGSPVDMDSFNDNIVEDWICGQLKPNASKLLTDA